MKKLKIFLLLGILLCFGFMLNSEVHAQDDGPKSFEINDVLPQGLVKITGMFVNPEYISIRLNNVSFIAKSLNRLDFTFGNSFASYLVEDNTDYSTGIINAIFDFSSLSESERTITSVTIDGSNVVYWEEYIANNAKPFEEGDELPAGYIKISWDFTGKPLSDGDTFFISGDYLDIEINQFDLPYNGYYIELDINNEKFIGDTPGYTIITLTEPSTIHSVSGDDYYDYVHGAIFWEALPPEYLGDYDDLYDGELLDIEEDYILPAAKIGIKLLYNNTGGSKSGTITYTFGTYGQIILTAQEDNLSTQVTSAEITYNFTNPNWNIYMIDDTLANQTFGSTRGILFAGVLLDFSWASTEERTITDITVEGDLDIDVIFTRILTEEEIAYQEGYSNGYTTAREIFGWKDGDDWYNGIDAWNLGEKYARELYGFYDSTTDEWLSVDEYVARYGPGNGNGNGNGSPGSSDFYVNFDKYFIPAMIIVFGGAIVLTILKVFKGRE